MNIRARTPKDDHAIAELNRLAFKRGNEALLVESIGSVTNHCASKNCAILTRLIDNGEQGISIFI